MNHFILKHAGALTTKTALLHKHCKALVKNTGKTIFYSLIVFFIFVSCGKTAIKLDRQDTDPSTFTLQMDPKDREEVVTNELFTAVADNQPIEEMEKLLANSDLSVLSVNKRGDTPFGTAIQLKRKEQAFFLLEKLECKDLSHQNNKGESYVYLSAEQGYAQLIHSIADKCYENNMFDFSDYEFSDLDPETLNGEIAIHTALTGPTASALDYEYTKGTLEYSWYAFHKTNQNEETFLHTAVKDSRINTVEWAVRVYCQEGEWEKSDSEWKQIPSSLFQQFWNGLQAHTWNMDQLVNYQSAKGDTALHLSARTLNEQSIRLLASCRWTDYLIENAKGNIPLQVFLSALDPALRNHDQEVKDVFVFLTHKTTYLKEWLVSISTTVNHQNKKGDSSLHISARLADPFFYNYLQKYGDVYLQNEEDKTPKEIFKSQQNTINSL